MELKTQVETSKAKKHVSKIDDLLNTSHVAESQHWETKVIWPDKSVLEEIYKWDNDAEDDEENIHDEQKEDEEEINGDSNEEEGDNCK